MVNLLIFNRNFSNLFKSGFNMSNADPKNNTFINYSEKFYNLLNNSIKDMVHTVLVVDDEPDNIMLLKRALRKSRGLNLITANNGEEALRKVRELNGHLTLIVSDQRMPKMTGTEFMKIINNEYPNIMKIVLTGYSDVDAMIDGINDCQLNYFLIKPVDLQELKLIISECISLFELKLSKSILSKDLKELFFTTIKSISSALDAKDTYTHGHSHRVTLYSLILAKELCVDDSMMEEIETAGLLHDIGKIGISEDILCKPGKLTDDEYETIKKHPIIGKKILVGIKKLDKVRDWIGSHHERWDGKGYLEGLKGAEIPMPARILSIADTYDAMTSNRSYRKGLPHEVASEEIKKCSGSQFDPDIVKIFMKVEHIFKEAIKDPIEYYNKYSILSKSLDHKE